MSLPTALCRYCLLLLLPAATIAAAAQKITQTSVPLGDALTSALTKSSLTGEHDRPFHLKVHIVERTNPSSDYHAEVEEYWASPEQWRRTIDSPGLKQVLIVNGAQTSETDTGDYYPLWLREFITGLFNPVPDAEQWEKMSAKIEQINLPDGRRSNACVRAKSRIGSDSVKNDAFSSVCFDGDGLLGSYVSPGYSMEFLDYKRFGDKMVARQLVDAPESGTELVGTVVELQELTKFDPSLLAVDTPTTPSQTIRSVPVVQAVIEHSALSEPEIVWPPVHSGNTAGLLSMYISVDRTGQVREAYPLNSDNAGLQDAARDQLLKWRLKPAVQNGTPVQLEAALSFRFGTPPTQGSATVSTPAETATPSGGTASPSPASRPSKISVSAGVIRGLLISNSPAPRYPEEARDKHLQGVVVLGVTISKEGIPVRVQAIQGNELLATAAVEAVRNWRYRPYMLGGQPVAVETTVNVVFSLGPH